MKRTWKKMASLILVGCLLTGLTACGGSNTGSGTDPAPDSGSTDNSTAPADDGVQPAEESAQSTEESSQPAEEQAGGYTINFMLAQSMFWEDAHNAIKDKMLADYGITVEYEIIPDDQFTNLSQVRLSTGEAPDVLQVNIPEANTAYDAPNTLVAMEGQPWQERLSMDVSGVSAEDGTLYGMPVTAYSGVMAVVYNKDVFAGLGIEVPKTYDDFLAALETVKTAGNGVTPLYLSFKDSWTSQIAPMIFFGNALDDRAEEVYEQLGSNQTTFAQVPEFKQALIDFYALFQNGYVNEDYVVGTYDASKEAVATGTAAMIVQGEYAVNDIIAKWPDANIGMFPLPYNDVDKVLSAEYVYSLVVPQQSESVENSLDFLNKLSQPEFLSLYLNQNAVNSPFADVKSENINSVLAEMYDNYLTPGKYIIQVGDTIAKFGSLNDDVMFPAYAQTALGEDIDAIISQIDAGVQEYGASLEVEGF